MLVSKEIHVLPDTLPSPSQGFLVHRPSLPLGWESLPLLKWLIMDLTWKNLQLACELVLLACISPILHTISCLFLAPKFCLLPQKAKTPSLSQRKLLPLGLYLTIFLKRAPYESFGWCQHALLSLCETEKGVWVQVWVLPPIKTNGSYKWLSRH